MHDFSDLTVIIPTLNEREDIPILISRLRKSYKGVKIIISDDGSTDGTKSAVERIAKMHSEVRFLDRSMKAVHGLTASVIDAAMVARTKDIVVMDGDMQHPPSKVGEVARALEKSDISVGVRSAIKDWGIHRRIISKSVNTSVYVIFKARGKHTTRDMMSGFFGIRAELFKHLIKTKPDSFSGRGYKVLLDILRVSDRSIRIAEIPYKTFHDRRHGKSKLKMLGLKQAPNILRSTLQ